MDKELFSLAAQGLRRSKGKALRVLAVLALSFGFALASLSLSASIQATNQEFAKNIYENGIWAFWRGKSGTEPGCPGSAG